MAGKSKGGTKGKQHATPPKKLPNPADLKPLGQYAGLIQKGIRQEYDKRMRGKD